MNKISWSLTVILFLFIWQAPAQAEQPLTIYTVNYPLAYFAERIAGEQAKVVFPVPADVDPAFWQPEIETIRAYQQADLILLNGAGYAKWVAKTSLPGLRTVDTSRYFKNQLIKSDAGGIKHSHGSGDTHSHAGTAFTTWLDLSQAVKQAAAISDALKRKRPQQSELFDKNLRQLEAELMQLDAQIKKLADKQLSLPLFASHPVYQYLARRYQLKLQSVMWEPEAVPDIAQWQVLKDIQVAHQANWMLWEAEPNSETVAHLKSMEINSLIYQPLGNRPVDGDFISIMQANLKNLEKAFISTELE
jgi:zinc transport system substrate-binding protein